jgi:hypothetical protein
MTAFSKVKYIRSNCFDGEYASHIAMVLTRLALPFAQLGVSASLYSVRRCANSLCASNAVPETKLPSVSKLVLCVCDGIYLIQKTVLLTLFLPFSTPTSLIVTSFVRCGSFDDRSGTFCRNRFGIQIGMTRFKLGRQRLDQLLGIAMQLHKISVCLRSLSVEKVLS